MCRLKGARGLQIRVSLPEAMDGRCQEGNEMGMLKPEADMQSGAAAGTPGEKRQQRRKREGGGSGLWTLHRVGRGAMGKKGPDSLLSSIKFMQRDGQLAAGTSRRPRLLQTTLNTWAVQRWDDDETTLTQRADELVSVARCLP